MIKIYIYTVTLTEDNDDRLLQSALENYIA